MSTKVAEFCRLHHACSDGRRWAIETGEPGMAELWAREDIKPAWRIWIATRPGVLTDRELRLFACWCCRQIWHLLTDERSRHAVEIAELYAEGKATSDELAAAEAAAGAAAWSAAEAAAWSAAWSAAEAAAWAAAWFAAGTAAWSAAEAAAEAAAGFAAGTAVLSAAEVAALAAAEAAQAAYLKAHAHPSF